MINILALILCHVFFKTIVLKNDSNTVSMTFLLSIYWPIQILAISQ